MICFDNEKSIIDYFIDDVDMDSDIAIFSDFDRGIKKILRSIFKWDNWIDSSAKDALPPDFYNDRYNLMMEVMRVDDTGGKRKGKHRNPTKEHEREIIRKYGLDKLENVQVIINADSGLPTKEDHNYIFYKKNFISAIKKHIAHIANYKKNHPNHKLIFFVMDESTEYYVNRDVTVLEDGQNVYHYPHICYRDKDFIDVINNTEIDYLIWYTPFKYFQTPDCGMQRNCPKAVIYKIKNIKHLNAISFDEQLMESAEE